MTYTSIQAYFAAWAAADEAGPAFFWGPSKRLLDAGRDLTEMFLWISEATFAVSRYQDGTQLRQVWTLQVEMRGPCPPDDIPAQEERMQETYAAVVRLLRYLNQAHRQGYIDVQDRIWSFREAENYEPEANWGWIGSISLDNPLAPCPPATYPLLHDLYHSAPHA